MTVRRRPAELHARLAREADRSLGAAEAAAYLAAPVTDAERDEALSLIRWFRQRYPTPAARLAYIRRAYLRWRANLE